MKKVFTLEGLKSIEIDEENKVVLAIYGDEAKPNLEAGKWYSKRKWVTLNTGGRYGVGFNDCEWRDDMSMAAAYGWKPANTDEVERLLITEAKKRGFKKGMRFLTAQSKQFTCSGKFFMNTAANTFNDVHSGCIFDFKTGVWAEIIEEKKPLYLIRKSDKKMFLQESSLDKFAEDDIHTKSMTKKECYQYLADHCNE